MSLLYFAPLARFNIEPEIMTVFFARFKYNNNAVFAGVIDIYGPHFFIYGPLVSLMPEA